MNYKDFKKAARLGKDKNLETILSQIKACESALEVFDDIKKGGNKDSEGKPIYTASVTVNIHGRRSEDGNESGLRSITYDTNLDFAEKKARESYDRLVKEFEEKSGE